jgi:hypothetical protein
MIEDSDVDQTQGIAQACRYGLIGLRGFRDSTRVRVGLMCAPERFVPDARKCFRLQTMLSGKAR